MSNVAQVRFQIYSNFVSSFPLKLFGVHLKLQAHMKLLTTHLKIIQILLPKLIISQILNFNENFAMLLEN